MTDIGVLERFKERERFDKAKEVTRKKWEALFAELNDTTKSILYRLTKFHRKAADATTCGFCQYYGCGRFFAYHPCPAGASDKPQTRCGKLLKLCENAQTIKEAKEVCNTVFKMLDNIRINDGGKTE